MFKELGKVLEAKRRVHFHFSWKLLHNHGDKFWWFLASEWNRQLSLSEMTSVGCILNK